MHFHEKMDFLMKITNTKNSLLARYMTVDASYISRMRRGDRAMPSNGDLIESMAEFFAKRSADDYVKTAILSHMGMNADTSITKDTLKELICNYLTHESIDDRKDTVSNILSGISRISLESNRQKKNFNKDIIVYYGTEGKRQAILSLLNIALTSNNTKELLLFSDENPELLPDNPSFSKTWTELITRLTNLGVHICVIHKISRDLNEMLRVINLWMPLYLSGNVEPYYYPNLRDGVYKRTLYIIPSLAAVSSSSIGDISDGTANMLVTAKKLVDAFAGEFYNYIALCRPVLKIFRENEILDELKESLKNYAGINVFSSGLPYMTIPLSLHKEMNLSANKSEKDDLSGLYDYFMAIGPFLEKHKITCIGYTNKLSDIKSGSVKVPLSNILYGRDIYYTAKTYKLHLLNIIYFMENYPSFSFILEDQPPFPDVELYVSPNTDAFIIQSKIKSALKIEEESMRSAFYHYVTNAKNTNSGLTRQETIDTLKDLAEQLSDT